ncbi:hypothetical protein [Marinobacter sp. ELB17]|uniref:hypothetical protein n=1 Tax=Marinobacter sp. ELB17 TaxID=270374 RepID=UPI0000F361F6|nr:hypothetical protein [Marinobacter sp. ELB17]EAZ98752.1 3-deoxy-7-phosphoheptulonate synthase [Marinobacter sp. ELB17]
MDRRLARTRFYLVWQLNGKGSSAFSDSLLTAFGGLQYLRGWNSHAGRSALVQRALQGRRLRKAEKQVFGLKPGHLIAILDPSITEAGVLHS